jgi:prevent-host-death family protein
VSLVVWQLQTAKQKLSEVVARSLDEGPQIITRHGEQVAVVLSMSDYRRLTADDGFKRLLRSGPSFDGLDLVRLDSPPRALDL